MGSERACLTDTGDAGGWLRDLRGVKMSLSPVYVHFHGFLLSGMVHCRCSCRCLYR